VKKNGVWWNFYYGGLGLLYNYGEGLMERFFQQSQ